MKKAYSTYKETNIPWAKRIPDNWMAIRYKYLFQEINERSETGTEDLLSVSQYTGVTLRKDRLEDERDNLTNAATLEGYKKVKVDDLVTNIMLAWNGSLGISPYQGIVSPAYCIYRGNDRVFPQYFHYLLRTSYSKGDFKKVSSGVIESRLRMYTDDFFALYTILPPLPEQRQIATYLDYKCALIDTFIAKKKRLIELLEEQKKSIIDRAVTKGIKQDITFEKTKNNWFTHLPKTWDLVQLRRVISAAVDGPHFSPNYLDEGIPFLSARNVKVGHWSLKDVKYISEQDYKLFCKRVKPEVGDVLYTKGGTTGVAKAVDLKFPFQVWVHVAVLKLKKNKIRPDFLSYCLNSSKCYEQSQLYTKGATNQDLGLGRMRNIFLPLPPSLEEQAAICDFLNVEIDRIDKVIGQTSYEISLLQEYKTTLIAEAVTGKIDVRDWSPPVDK